MDAQGAGGGGGSALTVGTFDGVHRGHMALLGRLMAVSAPAGARTVAVTFDPHPRCVVDPAGCPPLLCSVPERVDLLRRAGVDEVAVLDFTPQLAAMSAEDFCDLLVERFRPVALVEGGGFALGQGRAGDLEFLRDYGSAHGFIVAEVVIGTHSGSPVSSRRIREEIAAGRMREANEMLGRHYSLSAPVVAGRKVGARLGFPTANLAVPPDRCVPGPGVYATWLEVEGRWLPAATSIGPHPTFSDNPEATIEAHVLDFEGDVYGQDVRLAFARRLRGQKRFGSEAALAEAIRRDVERVRQVLSGARPYL